MARMFVFLFLAMVSYVAASDGGGGGVAGREIMVGGDEHWRFGFNYTDWAEKAGPFFVGDTLVFIYEQEEGVEHNVFQLHSRKQMDSCKFGTTHGGMLLANESEGHPPDGYRFVLTERHRNYYFACAIGDGLHCSQGLMKFRVRPI